ncbi:MAG: type II toxin-antitoxin system VapC family toxin [Candidatus Bathyarchaeia archaeon]
MIDSEELLVNTIIVMEVVHNLRRRAQLPPEPVYDYVLKMLALKKMTIAPFDRELLHTSMRALERYYEHGIGGRDATILATMLKWKVDTMATHDKNMLRITDFRRIDPTHHPPKTLEIGQPAK